MIEETDGIDQLLLYQSILWQGHVKIYFFIFGMQLVVLNYGLTTAENEKVDCLHVPAMKFTGWKQLVYFFPIILLKSEFL